MIDASVPELLNIESMTPAGNRRHRIKSPHRAWQIMRDCSRQASQFADSMMAQDMDYAAHSNMVFQCPAAEARSNIRNPVLYSLVSSLTSLLQLSASHSQMKQLNHSYLGS